MSFKIKLFLFFSFALVSVRGQDLDRLIATLDSVAVGEPRVDHLNNIASLLRERNIYEAVKYSTEAKSLAEKLKYQQGLGLALENLGWIYYRRGIYSNAFDLSHQALKISEERGDSIAMARCLNNVAAINYEKGQFAEAIERFKRAYIISSHMTDIKTSIRSLNNLSFSFLGLKRTDSAEFYALKALSESKENQQEYLPAFSYRILGDIAFEKGDMISALRHFKESMRISEATDNYSVQASTLHRIGKVYSKQGNYAKALEALNRNVDLSKKNGYADELERTYKLISEVNYAKHEEGPAMEYLMRYLTIHDSLVSQRNNEGIVILSTQFESERKQSQIELLTQNAVAREEAIEKQKAWTYFYVGCFVLGFFIAVILYYSNKRIIKANAELKEKTLQVEQYASEMSGLSKTKDKLLSIVSHDMRSPLSSLRGILNIVQDGKMSMEEFEKLTARIGSQLDSVNEDLGNLLQWTHSQLKGLQVKPENFELKLLADEVVNLYDNAAELKKIKLMSEVPDGTMVNADPDHVKLILRNLISNAIKFSFENGEVTVRNSMDASFVKVSVSDSGVGLSQDEIPNLFNSTTHFTKPGTANEKGMGVGLLLTKEFIDKNGGTVSVESELGRGTTFSFTLQKAM